MSHTTEVSGIVFKDFDALRAAVAELKSHGIKVELTEKSTPRAFYANQQGLGPADYVLRLLDAAYDVGFYMDEAKGGYVARTDLFGGSVAKTLGVERTGAETAEQAALGKLNQYYAVHAATRQAVKQGYSVRRVQKPSGVISLVMDVR